MIPRDGEPQEFKDVGAGVCYGEHSYIDDEDGKIHTIISLHYNPTKKFTLSSLSEIKEALSELAREISSRDDVDEIVARSWMVIKFEKLFKKWGFQEEVIQDDESKQDALRRETAQVRISKADFLKEFLK